MTTSDGISSEDWDLVHGFAVDVVNAPDHERNRHRQLLRDCLDTLEAKYGSLPSILATRADYLDEHDPAREELLIRAHLLAEERGDLNNVTLASQSLAELCLARRDLTGADQWLRRMKQGITAGTGSEQSEYDRLRNEYRRLAIRLADSSL